MTAEPGRRILVPVEDSSTLRETVAYAVAEAIEAAESDVPVAIHFVYAEAWRAGDPHFTERSTAHRDLLDQVQIWAESDREEGLGGGGTPAEESVEIETTAISSDRYLFSPVDYADDLEAYVEANGIERIVLDPEYRPAGSSALLRPLRAELTERGLTIEEAPVDRPARRQPFPQPGGFAQFLTIFGVSFAFYMLLAWSTATVDVATGLISAGIVGVGLSRISLTKPLAPRQTLGQLARFGLYVPYLLYEVTKANLSLAAVILHPRLPIDPAVVRFRAAVWGGLPVTTLANSITLTPGTLTVDVGDREFIVHSLTRDAREDLLAGSLERAVRYVFWGRAAAGIPSPAERQGSGEDSARE